VRFTCLSKFKKRSEQNGSVKKCLRLVKTLNSKPRLLRRKNCAISLRCSLRGRKQDYQTRILFPTRIKNGHFELITRCARGRLSFSPLVFLRNIARPCGERPIVFRINLTTLGNKFGRRRCSRGLRFPNSNGFSRKITYAARARRKRRRNWRPPASALFERSRGDATDKK